MSRSDCNDKFMISRENLADIKLNKKAESVFTSPQNPRHKCTNFQKPLKESSTLGTHNTLKESPVIGINSLLHTVISPEIPQFQSRIPQQLSPVIEKRYKRLKLKKSNSEAGNSLEYIQVQLRSPDLFASTQNIESDSPTFDDLTQASAIIEHFPTKESQESSRIEPFPSQLGSEVDEVVNNYVDSMYYIPAQRKKKLKKKSLAHCLNEALNNQKARVNIWSHELLNGIESVLPCDEDPLIFIFKRFWKEYGNTILECELCTLLDQKNLVLVNLGVTTLLNVEWEPGAKYELYKPYQVKTVLHNGEHFDCYFNVKKYLRYRSSGGPCRIE